VQKVTGVVIFFANHEVQEYIFIGERGGYYSRTEAQCSKDIDCLNMVTVLTQAKKVDMIDWGNCPVSKADAPL
jgi:hypothetical protein